jgi:ribose 5-phosphate isomerase A
MNGAERSKDAAAQAAIDLVADGMRLGIGSGSTVNYAIRALAREVQKGRVVRLAVASGHSDRLARELGLEPEPLADFDALDLAIDGTDECDPGFNLIKGGGGALVREKLIALAADRFVVIADESKRVERLGRFPLPVAILQYGWRQTLTRLARYCPQVRLREVEDHILVSDDGLLIADMEMSDIPDPRHLEANLKREPGVVEVGLFCGLAERVIYGRPDYTTETLFRA